MKLIVGEIERIPKACAINGKFGASVARVIGGNGNVGSDAELKSVESSVGTIEPKPSSVAINSDVGFAVAVEIGRREFIG